MASAARADGSLKQEAFGFFDGICQPRMRGTGRRSGKAAQRHRGAGRTHAGVPRFSGDLLRRPRLPPGRPRAPAARLGRDPFVRAESPDAATGRRDFGRNGTFLVVRQLEQHVGAFNLSSRRDRGNAGVTADETDAVGRQMIAAKIVGRWRTARRSSAIRTRRDRTPTRRTNSNSATRIRRDCAARWARTSAVRIRATASPAVRTSIRAVNRTGFFAWAVLRCREERRPRSAVHVRERRYRPAVGVVQGSWILNPSFSGLEYETDPLVGHEAADRRFTLCTAEGPMRLRGLREFVRMRGGGYFFLPGRAAYRFLATFGAQ